MKFSWSLLLLLVLLLELTVSVSEAAKKKKKKSSKWKMRCNKMMSPLQEELKQLQRKVETLSNPVHVHLHGVADGAEFVSTALGTAMEAHDHDVMENEKGRDHHSHEEDLEEEVTNLRESHVHVHLNIGSQAGQGGSHTPHSQQGHGHKNQDEEFIYAKCEMTKNSRVRTSLDISGAVYLRQKPNDKLEILMNLRGFSAGRQGEETLHGFHVHEFGDFERGCNSFGGHYNPEGHDHGAPDEEHKHVGDWGNIQPYKGVVVGRETKSGFLYGPQSLVGRGIVIHAETDDLGRGGAADSKTTGAAGARVACCIIALHQGEKYW